MGRWPAICIETSMLFLGAYKNWTPACSDKDVHFSVRIVGVEVFAFLANLDVEFCR